ncbi:hypothetical protein C8T65DRAFT_664232 [Cerioporus squamosus]|nr:hypothetical protein C8T65DRAFT_664232 [Cerioporus squamosus]
MAFVTDPDRLVFFLSGLREENMADRRRTPLIDDNNKTVHRSFRTAMVLDALARLLVHEVDGPGQVFAVAIVPRSLTHSLARLIISENSEVTEAAMNHARSILQDFYAVRKLVDNLFPGGDSPPPQLHIPSFIPPHTDDLVQRKLVGIETAIIRHSWSKIGKRFRKANRHTAFFDVSDVILAPGAKDSDRLASLKAKHGWPPGDSFLQHFVNLTDALKELDTELQNSAHDYEVEQVRTALSLARMATRGLRASMPKVFDMCADLSAPDSVDFGHWIDKVISTRSDFLQLQRIIAFPTLHDVLTEQIEVISVVPKLSPADVFVTVDNLRDALPALVGVSDEDLDGYLRMRFKKRKDELVTVPGRIHCECAVLAELHRMWGAGDTPIPYVGVSKLSCAVCSLYFAAYREVTEHDVKTRGTHDQMYPWRCPTIDDKDVNRDVCAELSEQLRTLLGREVKKFADERRNSTSSVMSQTTVASDEIVDPDMLSGAPFIIHPYPLFA